MPASMLSPPSLVATWCALRIAVASIRVVVDLPLVPVMSATGRPNPRFFMIWGSIFSATSPPIMPPEPRPVAREAKVASRASPMAALVRARKRGKSLVLNYRLETRRLPFFRGWRVDRPVIERSTGEVSGGGVGSPGVICVVVISVRNSSSAMSGTPFRAACMALPDRLFRLLHTTNDVCRVTFSE